MVPNWGDLTNAPEKKIKASQIPEEVLEVLDRHVPANTPDGAIIGKIEKAIERFKANSRKQK